MIMKRKKFLINQTKSAGNRSSSTHVAAVFSVVGNFPAQNKVNNPKIRDYNILGQIPNTREVCSFVSAIIAV
jgi:hypothetical protein